MKTKIYKCDSCKSEIDLLDCFCGKCGAEFDFAISNIRKQGNEIAMELEGHEYTYTIPSTIKTGKYAGKSVTVDEVVHYLNAFLKNAGAGKLIQWVKNNLVLKSGSKKEVKDSEYNEEKISLDTYRNKIREFLTKNKINPHKIDIILERREIMQYWKEGLSIKECLSKMYNIK